MVGEGGVNAIWGQLGGAEPPGEALPMYAVGPHAQRCLGLGREKGLFFSPRRQLHFRDRAYRPPMDLLGSLNLAFWTLEKGRSILCITIFFFFNVLPALRGTWDLSSLTRKPCLVPPALEGWSPTHWTTREVFYVHIGRSPIFSK